MKHLYLIGRADYVAADNKKQAGDTWLEITGETAVDYPDLEIELIRANNNITVIHDVYNSPDGERTTKLAIEWAKDAEYPDIICSTEW